MDAHKNLAVSTVATAPSPATSGTSLVVAAGEGGRFPTPPFNATVWPAGVLPDPLNAEIVRVTGVSTDTLTITRAQESTSARSVLVGDLIAATITAKTLTDIEGATALFNAYAYLRDEKTAGTNGGTFTNGAWRTRDLNTEVFDPDGIVSLSANQFTLGAATYLIKARAPAWGVDRHQLRLRDITNTADLAYGNSVYSANPTGVQGDAWLHARVTLAGTTAIELQHQCETTVATNGMGVATNWSIINIYAEVRIYREA